MSTDYAKKKNAELEDLLKARSLPHNGKKADLIARLQQYDTEQAAKSNAATTAGAEDEIDWDDDAPAAEPTGAAAIAAGGLGQPANPTAVPNQVVDTDPSKTNDLTVDPPAPTAEGTEAAASVEDVKAAEANKKKSLPSTGIKATTLDDELAKRQKRAARFGIKESDDDALKALERAKRFGTGDAGDKVAVRGLDTALPERAARGQKRGREGDDGTRRDGREKRSRVRGGGRNRRERSATPKDGVKKEGVKKVGSGLSDRDRLAAEARKKRFAGMA